MSDRALGYFSSPVLPEWLRTNKLHIKREQGNLSPQLKEIKKVTLHLHILARYGICPDMLAPRETSLHNTYKMRPEWTISKTISN
jgi:hypothetical protein